MAARSDDPFDDVAARAAHELASPLNQLVVFAEILRGELPAGAMTPDAALSLEHIVGSAQRARAVVDAFHEWARAGREPELESAPLAACLDAALDSLGPRAAAAEIERAGAFAPGEDAAVRAEPKRLARILAILLENAFTYVAGGATPRVRVDARREGGRWVLDVDDAGIGVAPGDRDEVLRSFVRLHGRREYPGVGLGLATACRIAEAHGGSLALGDSPLGGVRARVTLPATP